MTVLVLRKTPGGFRSIIKSIRKPEIFGSKKRVAMDWQCGLVFVYDPANGYIPRP